MSRDVPTRIGRYTVEKSLGSGGMGEVFLAYSPAGSPVAVKLIRTDRLDPHTRARFEREAQIARTVVGTNRVARFLDADPDADRPWLAMEYVPGQTLLDFVTKHGVLAAPLVASLGALLAEGLDAVHASGLLHRDLKPQNVILGVEGPMIIDFGLAALMDASSQDSLSRTGTIIGTVRCMPPEQADGNPRVTPAADVYALGTVLLFAATGHYPFEGRTWKTIVAQIVNAKLDPDLDGVPEVLIPLLQRMLAYEPHDRPSVDDVAEACAEILRGAKVTPAQARLALVARTTEGDVPRPENPVPSHSVVALLGALEPSGGDVGPLDVPPEAPTEPNSEVDARKAQTGEGPPDRELVRGSGRRPASKRIADKLRADYAAQPSL